MFLTKRKEFKSAEQRGIEEAALAKTKPDTKKPQKPAKNNKWKMQSEQFRANMKAARMATSGDEAGYQEAMKIASDYEKQQLVPCPHCGRTFNDEAAKRHIPICAGKLKISQLKQGGKQPPPKGRK